MLEDPRAHKRLDLVEDRLDAFEHELRENTAATKTIADNTTELVMLVKGAKNVRTFLWWSIPIATSISWLGSVLRDHWK